LWFLRKVAEDFRPSGKNPNAAKSCPKAKPHGADKPEASVENIFGFPMDFSSLSSLVVFQFKFFYLSSTWDRKIMKI